MEVTPVDWYIHIFMQPSIPVIPPRRSLAFFASLAMLMVVVSYLFILLLATACVYLPWLVITNVANFQTLALFVAGVIVAASMLWSLVPRRDKFATPGLPLERVSHGRLFAELDGIADALREPLPREVYLIGEPNAWVADRGGLMGFGSRRVMGLGLPLLGALNISQFRAILAHEFAHYYGGDTKLGPWLHRTQMAMIRTFQNMGSVGKAMRVALMQVLYVVVFGILKWYWLLFLRAINFVSRRQEFRADELACIVAGPQPLVSGLRIVHGASIAWPAYWNTEVAPMLKSGFLPSIAGGFAQFLSAPAIAKQVERAIEKEMREGKTEPYDSHPPLRDRVAAAEALPNQSQPDDTQSAWSLLEDGGAAELAFLEALNPEMPKNALKRVSWEEQGSAVLIPSWTSFVSEYAPLLQGITAGNLAESTGKVPEIASQIRDPKGMLLTPEQRVERARSLLSTAFGLALVKNGWKVHSSPGEFHLDQGDEELDPHTLMLQISDGIISKEAWATKCKKLGIEGLPLAIAPEHAAAKQEPLPFG
ncbi:MAG: M48 family metalloprotease [Acidobacteriia bacterium]|nr:M48 family metalloprotease [Terriglobia bacterium]